MAKKLLFASLPGFEPGTFGLEVQRAIHCATGTVKDSRLQIWDLKLTYIPAIWALIQYTKLSV